MNHSQRKTGPILSEPFSSDVLHSILGSPTDTVVQALNEAFDDAKVANITQSAKNMLKKFFNNDFIIDYQAKFGAIRSRLRKLLALKMIGTSDYAVYNTPNGRFAFRLADHNANGDNFRQDNAKINISVYVAFREFNIPESDVQYKEYKILPEVYNENKQKVIESIIKAVSDTLNGSDFILDDSIAKLQEHPKINIKNYSKNTMTYNEKKSLYENIMRDVAKTVKSRITCLDESESKSFEPYTRRLNTLNELGDDISMLSKMVLMGVIDCVLSYEESGSANDEIHLKEIGNVAKAIKNWVK